MPSPPHLRALLPPLCTAVILLTGGACVAERTRDPFTATGEVIALSGGDAGAERACFTCHGLRGEGGGGSTPRLASLPAGYLQKQLIDYAAGRRADKIMAPIARALDHDDRRAVSAYYAALAPAPPAAAAGDPGPTAAVLYHRGAPARGLPPCAACHGAVGEGMGPANPPLADQPSAYLAEQIHRWRRSERRNDPRNAMLEISRRLTPAEVEAISRYASGLAPGAAPGAEHRAAYR